LCHWCVFANNFQAAAGIPGCRCINYRRRVVQVRLGVFKNQTAGVFVKRLLELESFARQFPLVDDDAEVNNPRSKLRGISDSQFHLPLV